MSASYPTPITPYPVRVQGRLDQPSRWSWLLKWVLALPHLLVLAFLLPAFAGSSVFAVVTVAATGRYPRALFDFNLGVMRWSWRVAFYAYAANGTDRYPPFTLSEQPDYPARLDIAFPEHQRRGLPMIGWWLAGAPHYAIVAILMGGGVLAGTALGGAVSGGLIGLLVLTSAVTLLFRGSYPQSIFDLVLGLDRWVLRVVAYAAAMTSEYPPFRLDIGANDVDGPITATPSTVNRSGEPARGQTWSAARITKTTLASIASLIGIALIGIGAVAIGADRTQRSASGYLTTGAARYTTRTYALMSDSYSATTGIEQSAARVLLGKIQIKSQSTRPVFIGIAPASAANAYLSGVAHAQAAGLGAQSADFRTDAGGAPITRPTSEHFWVASTAGAGLRKLDWHVRRGSWRVVVMNANGRRGVDTRLSVAATAPHLLVIGSGSLVGGLLVLLLGAGSLYLISRPRH